MDRIESVQSSPTPAPVAVAPVMFFWLMTVRTADGAATQSGTLTWLPTSTREQLYHLIKDAVTARLGDTDVAVLAFVLEPNTLGGAR